MLGIMAQHKQKWPLSVEGWTNANIIRSMSEHFIDLNCTNCGGKLEVYDDMERFACGYCGSQMLVQRRGGTVALKAVIEAIHKVQIGTDKTAAELAIARLYKELEKLKTDHAKFEAAPSTSGAFGILVVLLVVSVIFALAGPRTIGIVSALVLGPVIVFVRSEDAKQKQRRSDLILKVKSEIFQVEREIDRNRKIVQVPLRKV
jgi:ribosomal protein S27E